MASEGQERADALGWGRRPNQPKTFARYHTIPQKVTTVSIYDKGPGHPEGYPDPYPFLLLELGHARATPLGGILLCGRGPGQPTRKTRPRLFYPNFSFLAPAG